MINFGRNEDFLFFFRYSQIKSLSVVESSASVVFDSSSLRKKFGSHVSSGSDPVNSN